MRASRLHLVPAAALSLGELLEAEVEAIHVTTDAGPTVERSAEAAGVPRVVAGEVVEQLVEAGEADDVAALVVGARGVPTGPRPLGTTARAVASLVQAGRRSSRRTWRRRRRCGGFSSRSREPPRPRWRRRRRSEECRRPRLAT